MEKNLKDEKKGEAKNKPLVQTLLSGLVRTTLNGSAFLTSYTKAKTYPWYYTESAITQSIVRRFRKKWSWFYIFYHIKLRPKGGEISTWIPELPIMSRNDMYRITALYVALKNDIGEGAAIAAVAEVLRSLHRKRQRKRVAA